tara:strand:- start:35 stop:403 length:369 start_codon:yes stop_codon:yes gene_type:complete
MKMSLITKLYAVMFVTIGLLFMGCGEHDHDHDHNHDHDHDHDHGKPEETSSSDDNYPLKTCLVTDEELTSMGKPYVKVWNGTTIKLCCEGCMEDFEKEPKKFLAKLESAKKEEVPTQAPAKE